MRNLVQALFQLRSIIAVLAALLVGSILILIAGGNPLTAYGALFHGAFLDYWGIADTLVKMGPLLLAGLAVILPLRTGIFNIGADGQIYIGALFGTIVALYLPGLPTVLHILLICIAGGIGGALWAFIPAMLRAYAGINEIIVALLLNFVALYLVGFAVSGPMFEPGAPYPYSPEIADNVRLPILMARTDAHVGVLVGVGMAALMFVIFKFGSLGFTLRLIGQSPHAAKYSGISVSRHIVVTFMIAGAIAGLAGTLEIIGFRYRLYDGFSHGMGYDGIIVAFLANLNPLFAVLSALFIGGLRAGAGIMQRAVGIETSIVEAIQGLVILFVAVSLAFKPRKEDKQPQAKKTLESANLAAETNTSAES